MQKESKLYLGDCLDVLPTIESNSIDAIVTDPPYGISFMLAKWDVSVPSIDIWQECLRVLKPGAFAFVMSSPRQDVLSRMIVTLTDAGFDTGFSSIYWTYASGFPKAQNISKQINKRAGVEREVIAIDKVAAAKANKNEFDQCTAITPGNKGVNTQEFCSHVGEITKAVTPQAKALEGAYSGFQPKPAVEVVIVAMKPLSEKTYLDQAMSNMHGCTWLDDCRIPTQEKNQVQGHYCGISQVPNRTTIKKYPKELGRFPANVVCEDNVLDEGITRKTGSVKPHSQKPSLFCSCNEHTGSHKGDTGSFGRYFSLDAWFAERIKQLPKEAQRTFPWLIVPKASKSEKNQGCEDLEGILHFPSNNESGNMLSSGDNKPRKIKGNFHPTCKPLKLMMWLITLSSREGDIILDPFMGSGTTPLAAKMVHRAYKGIELKEEFFNTAVKRADEAQQSMDRFS